VEKDSVDTFEGTDRKKDSRDKDRQSTRLWILIWYSAACVAVVTSKITLQRIGAPAFLSFSQSVVATLAVYIAFPIQDFRKFTQRQYELSICIGVVYSLGFLLTNL